MDARPGRGRGGVRTELWILRRREFERETLERLRRIDERDVDSNHD